MTVVVLIDGEDVDITSDPFVSIGGKYILVVRADEFGSGIVEVQYSARPLESELEARWSTLQNGIFTSDAEVMINYVPNGHGLRAKLVGAGIGGPQQASTDNVFVELKQ